MSMGGDAGQGFTDRGSDDPGRLGDGQPRGALSEPGQKYAQRVFGVTEGQSEDGGEQGGHRRCSMAVRRRRIDSRSKAQVKFVFTWKRERELVAFFDWSYAGSVTLRRSPASVARVNGEHRALLVLTGRRAAMAGIKGYWTLATAAIAFRILLLFCLPKDFHLGSHPEITTPLTSLRRLAEGYWLKQASMSPYSGSMYHGSPVLLSILGPLSTKRSDGRPPHFYCSLLFVFVDFITATLIRATGKKLLLSRQKNLQILNLSKLVEASGFIDSGDFAALMYLWNPMTIVVCIGSSTSPIDNLMVVMAIYGACSRIPPLAAFGWVFAVHLSLYPVILIVPIILLLGYGLDAPPSKLFLLKNSYASKNSTLAKSQVNSGTPSQTDTTINHFSWIPVLHFALWVSVWLGYLLFLSSISLKEIGSITEMFRKTYGFILTVEDLSPNIGLLWYFFAEVFDFFRNFFLIVFHVNILFMILPLAIRLKHRPCFLAFVYIAISSMLKSYPSIADSTLYLSLVALFSNELADMQFSFFLFCGYIGVSLFSPVMHNLWIWRGTGNANFYYATGLAYACLQTILVVESVGSMLKHDRLLRKTVEAETSNQS